jgi:hypothetical protein
MNYRGAGDIRGQQPSCVPVARCPKDLDLPVSVGPQEDLIGTIWFFFQGAPKDAIPS